ncbi:hypothetical protein EDB89DRAFT_771476 [Lactarius sanguifluus]|nr:hypothetical protein EDB89DRAFT_771476 [Lactarius sanguifluus]
MQFCSALHGLAERRVESSNPQYGSFCLQGKVQIDFVARLLDELYELYSCDSTQAKEFRLHLRRYNKVFTFTSMGGSDRLDGTMFDGRGPPFYKIQRKVFHKIGPLLPEENKASLYSQLYIYDPADALQRRKDHNRQMRAVTMSLSQDLILQYHPFVEVYRQVYELSTSTDLPEVIMNVRTLHRASSFLTPRQTLRSVDAFLTNPAPSFHRLHVPTMMYVTGIVVSVERDIKTFTVFVAQRVTPTTGVSQLITRANLKNNASDSMLDILPEKKSANRNCQPFNLHPTNGHHT